MRVRVAVSVAAVVLSAGLAGFQAGAGAAPSVAAHTVRVVVRPVTSSGHPATGFSAKAEPTGSVDCGSTGGGVPSRVALSKNILECSPSAEYAVACWKAAAPKHVLCMRNPRSHKLARIPRTGGFAHTGPAPRKERGPLRMILSNGAVCGIRDGGAWGILKSHPKWVGTYSCTKGGDVWAPMNSRHQGIDESHPVWTVHTAKASGKGPVHVRSVRKAYFVGTAG